MSTRLVVTSKIISHFFNKLLNINISNLLLLALAIFLTTSFRKVIPFGNMLIIPFFMIIFNLRISVKSLIIVLCIMTATILAIYYSNEFYPINNIISIYIILPCSLFFLSNPKNSTKLYSQTHIKKFLLYLIIMIGINNLIGFAQYLVQLSDYQSDDAFIGIYGRHGIGVHGLSILNGYLLIFFLGRYIKQKKILNIILLAFFSISFILTFFGFGFISLLAAIAFYYLFVDFKIIRLLRTVIIFCGISLLLFFASPKTFEYYINNVKLAYGYLNNSDKTYEANIPRKLAAFKNYYELVKKNKQVLFWGTSPGTFNSRVSFLLNGEYTSDHFTAKFAGNTRSSYAEEYIYPLWNNTILNSTLYMDGTRNQPFSSWLALLSEYGLISFLIFFILIFSKIRKVTKRLQISPDDSSYYSFLTISSLYTFFLCFGENLFEHSEFFVFLMIFKLIDSYSFGGFNIFTKQTGKC